MSLLFFGCMHWVYPSPHRQANDDLFMFGRAPLSVFTFHWDHGTGRHSNYGPKVLTVLHWKQRNTWPLWVVFFLSFVITRSLKSTTVKPLLFEAYDVSKKSNWLNSLTNITLIFDMSLFRWCRWLQPLVYNVLGRSRCANVQVMQVRKKFGKFLL